jgi:ATP-binding cassette subfamily B multidrug efflux pump
MRRAVQYLTHYKREAALPYVFLVIATLAQLAIPTLIGNIINAVTSGYVADQVLQALNQIPTQSVGAALPNILSALNYPANWTKDQLVTQLNANLASAPPA